MKKRLGSVLLSLALLLTFSPALGGAAKAANATTLYIAGNTAQFTGMYYTEGSTALKSGETVGVTGSGTGSARFTYNSSGSSTLTLMGWCTKDNAGYVRDDCLYGIYYEGDLTIDVQSKNGGSTITSSVTNKTGVYGIYVTGDLTIGGSGKLTVEMSGDASGSTYGIYCGGKLTIGSSVTVKAGTVTGMKGSSGAIKSCGIYAGTYEQTNGTVKATGGSGAALVEDVYPTPEIALETFGVCGKNGVNVSAGSLIATGGTVPMSGSKHGGRSVGILAGELNTETAAPSVVSTLTVSGTAKVTATGGTVNTSASNGIIAWNRCMSCGAAAHKVDVRGGSLTAIGADLTASGSNNGGNADSSGGESFGVRCGAYVQSGGAVTATAGKSDIKPQKRFSDSYGVFTYKYDVSDGTLAASADQAWRESVGIMVHNELVDGGMTATQSGGTVSGTAAVVAGYVTPQTEPCQSTGVWIGADYEATGGSLSGTGANIGYHRQSTGVLFNGNVSLSGGASVTGTGGKTSKFKIGCTLNNFTGNGGGVSSSCGVAFGGTTLTLGGNCTLSGTGGNVTGAQGAIYRVDSIGVWFAGTDVSVSGGGTISGTGGTGAQGHGCDSRYKYYSDNSYGIYAEGALSASGVTVEAMGGDVSTTFVTSGATEPGQYEQGNTYGVYITDDASFSNCTVTASGGSVGYTSSYVEGGGMSYSVGLHSKGLTLDGSNEMAFTGGAWSGNGQNRYFKSYGLEFTGDVTLAHGRLAARGHTGSIFNGGTIRTAAYLRGDNLDGSDAAAKKGPTVNGSSLRNYRYAFLDEKLVVVTMIGTIYSGYQVQTALYNAPEGEATYHYTGRSGTEYDSADAPTDVGSYTVEVSFADSDYYGRTAFAMTPKELTIEGLAASDKMYNGKTNAALTGTPELCGVCAADADKVALSGTPAGAFADAKVGENKTVTVSGLTLTGDRAFNYTLAELTLTASITPAPISVEGELSGDKLTYTVTGAPEGAQLIAARYDEGRLTDVQTATVSGNASDEFTMKGSGDEYRLMLIDGETFAPLCEAWISDEK